jgi:sterol desaturase/sphingolipid hydroxylase (fatty acid hydroxylase superfamily)
MEKRIEKNVFPDSALIQTCLQKLVINHLLAQPIALYLAYPYFAFMGLTVRSSFPAWTILARDFAISAVLNDFLFFFGHRILHHKSIYKYVHKEHHRFQHTIGVAAEYAHPVEEVVSNLIPTLIGCFLMGSHISTLWIWLSFRLMETIDAHSGYAFDWSPSRWSPFSGGSERHYFHHSHNTGCYGAIYLDSLFGTDATYLEYTSKKLNQSKDL